MADIVARLRLDNKDYEDKLAKAKKSTKNFSQEGGAGLSDMMGKFTALAGAVAASKAAMEVFNAVVSSSQTIGDAYTQAMEGAKGAVNEFVYSVANADFSGFNGGLKDIIKNAKEAAAAMDALGNAQISYDYLTAGYKASFQENIGKAKDKSLSTGERQAAYEAAIGDLAKIEEAVKGYTDKAINAVVESAESKGNNINKDFINRENIDRIMALDISANGEAEKKALSERYDEFKKLKKQEEKLEKAAHVARMNGYASAEQYEQKLADLRAKINSDDMQMAALYNAMLVKGTDEWLVGLTGILTKADNAKREYESLETSTLRVRDNIAGASTKQAELAKNVKLTAEQYAQSFGQGFYTSLGNRNSFGAKRDAAYDQATGKYNAAIHEDVPIIDTMFEEEEPLPEMPAIKENTANLEAMTEQTYTAADAMNALGSTMSSLSSIVGEDAAAWLDWGTNVISAVAQAIPQITALTAAKKKQTTANTTEAATGAASSVASIPYVGPIMAVAAVASVLAALANLPKFAQGGIVPGTSFTGDNVLIRANSGERVLTREQNAQYERGMGFGGTVKFKIEGGDLVGVLNNNQKIASRSYGH